MSSSRACMFLLIAACSLAPLQSGHARLVNNSTSAVEDIGPVTSKVDTSRYQELRYVAQSAASDQKGDGSALKPWRSISSALAQINDARASKRYAVLVGKGTYTGGTIAMKEYVDLYGGYEPSRWERDLFAQPSVLDGGGTQRVLIGADNCRLDGFVVKRGQVRGKGAGLLCAKVSPTIVNSIFTENRTLAPESWAPKELHEVANDGAAIACLDGASPTVERNLFTGNSTEVGRGAGIACDNKASPLISRNVFVGNTTGLNDSQRSSDGGAISVYDYSSPRVLDNIIAGNRALGSNDAGGIFVALWCSPLIAGNIIISNESTDDAGGIFMGGQKHHYSTPLDPLPPKDKFYGQIIGNIIMGNMNRSGNSGAMRVTMESRALIANNVIAENRGGPYLQRSEVELANNTIVDPVLLVETKEGLKPSVLINNIIWTNLDQKTVASVSYCDLKSAHPGEGNMSADPLFVDDSLQLTAESSAYDPARGHTRATLTGGRLKPNELARRVIRSGGKWGVVTFNDATTLTAWGDLSGEKILMIVPTYHLRADSPCIDRGTNAGAPDRDLEGNLRPANGGRSKTADIGAFEYISGKPGQ